MRIAIVGTGGVGGYFGGRLAQAGHSVAFFARGAHLAAIRARGLEVRSVAGDFTIAPVEATDAIASIGPVELAIVAVKAWQVADVARAMPPLIGPATCVLPLENGVEAADQLAAALGREYVLGGLCRIWAKIGSPGVIEHLGIDPQIEFGELRGGPSERTARVLEVLQSAASVSARVVDDIESALWQKFLFIDPFGGVGAFSRLPIGGIRADAAIRALLEGAMREVAAVARARGVALASDVVERSLAFVDGMPEGATASMQRDLLEGRPSELESMAGAVVRLGREAGVAVPVHEQLYAALLPLEREARVRAGLAPAAS